MSTSWEIPFLFPNFVLIFRVPEREAHKLGFNPQDGFPQFPPRFQLGTSPRNKLINGKIATTNSSSEIFNALLAGRFIFLITHVPLFVTPSVAVTHPIVIHWYVFVHWHQPWWGDHHFAHVRRLTKSPNNGWQRYMWPSGHLPLRFPESRALRNVRSFGPTSIRNILLGEVVPTNRCSHLSSSSVSGITCCTLCSMNKN